MRMILNKFGEGVTAGTPSETVTRTTATVTAFPPVLCLVIQKFMVIAITMNFYSYLYFNLFYKTI